MDCIARSYHRTLLIGVSVLMFATTGPGCGGAQTGTCNPNDMSNAGQSSGACFSSDSPVDAVVAAGAAAAATAVVGCTVNGCLPPYRCNGETKLCEPVYCDERNECPSAYECNLATHECQ